MSEATLYTGYSDYDSIVLRWLVKEKEAPLTVKRLGTHTLHMIEPPYLVDRELQLFDHWTIVQYMQERYPGEQLMPVDPQVRAQIRQMCVLLREGEGIDYRAEIAELLDTRYPFLLGDMFTMADVYAGARLVYEKPNSMLLIAYKQRMLGRVQDVL